VDTLPAPCWIASDAHLGVAPASHEDALLAWLDAAADGAGSVLLNGDLFEFWFGWRHVVPRAAVHAVAALRRVTRRGVPVAFLPGNHDCWGLRELAGDTGVTVLPQPWRGSVGGWRAHVDHGDGLRDGPDRGYRGLRAVLRHPLAIALFRWVHPDWATPLALGSSHTSRNTRPRDGGAGLHDVAWRTLGADATLDLVVFGHSHVPTLVRAPGGGVYANPGAWLDTPRYLVVTPERIELRQWDGSAEGDRLDVVDRRPEEALR
jgi:UDP-2,3-diacylglucosamine hydrolase